MGSLLETESPASFVSAAAALLVEHIQRHLRKIARYPSLLIEKRYDEISQTCALKWYGLPK